MSRLQIFCEIDDFCLWFVPVWESRMLPPADHNVRRQAGADTIHRVVFPNKPESSSHIKFMRWSGVTDTNIAI